MLTYKLDEDYAITLRTTEDIINLFYQMHLSSKVQFMQFDEAHMRVLLEDYSSNIKEKIILLLLYKDTPVGFLAGQNLNNFLYPSVKFAYELSFFVQPEHRKQHSWALVEAFEEWAKFCGCQVATLAHPCIPILEQHYINRGYQPVELTHYKELV